MTVLDPAATPPFGRETATWREGPPIGGEPPLPAVYYDFLARRWGVAAETIPAPGAHFHVSDALEHAPTAPYRLVISAWRSGRSRWLVSCRRCADGAREAWQTPVHPTTGWPAGLHQLIQAHADGAARCDDGWVLLIWPQTLRPVADPLLAKRVERLRARDAGRLPDDLQARADRAGALRRGELWAIFDSAGRRVISWLWTRPYTERVRSVGLETAEGHRDRGLAKALLSVATRDLLADGFLPTYGVRTNNPASQQVALSVGYLPAARDLLLLEKA